MRSVTHIDKLKEKWGIPHSSSQIYKLERQGNFPKHFKLGRLTVFFDDEIAAHLEKSAKATRGTSSAPRHGAVRGDRGRYVLTTT